MRTYTRWCINDESSYTRANAMQACIKCNHAYKCGLLASWTETLLDIQFICPSRGRWALGLPPLAELIKTHVIAIMQRRDRSCLRCCLDDRLKFRSEV